MPGKRTVGERQWEVLLGFMVANPHLARGSLSNEGPQGKQRAQAAWTKLSSRLNSISHGCRKSTKEWREYWASFKYTVRKKARRLHATQTGAELIPKTPIRWTDREEKVLELLGPVSVYGEPSVRAPFEDEDDTDPLPSPMSPSSPAALLPPLPPFDPPQPQAPVVPPPPAFVPPSPPANGSPTWTSTSLEDSPPQSPPRQSQSDRNRVALEAPDWVLRLEEKRLAIDQEMADAATLQASQGQELIRTLQDMNRTQQELVRAVQAQTRELQNIRRTLEAKPP